MLRGGMGAMVVVVVVAVAAVVVVRRSTSSRFASSVPLDAFFMKAAFRCRTAGAAAFGTSSPSSGSNVGRLPVDFLSAFTWQRARKGTWVMTSTLAGRPSKPGHHHEPQRDLPQKTTQQQHQPGVKLHAFCRRPNITGISRMLLFFHLS